MQVIHTASQLLLAWVGCVGLAISQPEKSIPSPLTYIEVVSEDEKWLYQMLGHVITRRTIYQWPRAEWSREDAPSWKPPWLQKCTLHASFRCYVHTETSLSSECVLDPASRSIIAGTFVVIVDAYLQESLSHLVRNFAQRFGSLVDVHLQLAQQAQRYRYGHHVYPECGDLAPIETSIHRNVIDLVWVLLPMWDMMLPANVSMVNIGCRDLSRGDPFHAMLNYDIVLNGLCVDVDGLQLVKAQQRLKKHAVKTLESFATPHAVETMLKASFGEPGVDILAVDIDSFDASVLQAALSVVSAKVVVAEYEYTIPPPFRYARQYAGESTWPDEGGEIFHGASLVYLVELLAGMGFFLYKLNHMDAVFIHKSLAPRFTASDSHVSFPVDEWACYFTRTVFDEDDRVPQAFTREWLLSTDVHAALTRLWGNLSQANRAPFTLDIAPLRGSSHPFAELAPGQLALFLWTTTNRTRPAMMAFAPFAQYSVLYMRSPVETSGIIAPLFKK